MHVLSLEAWTFPQDFCLDDGRCTAGHHYDRDILENATDEMDGAPLTAKATQSSLVARCALCKDQGSRVTASQTGIKALTNHSRHRSSSSFS
jgi:hypothetical protein